jgi:hypothetical protein
MSRKRQRPSPAKTSAPVAPLAEQGAYSSRGIFANVPPVSWLLLLTLGCLLPFIAKPFHIDDPLFVWVAEQIRKHSGDFYGFQVNWFHTFEPMHEVFQNPPLVCYYIAAWSSCFGWSEVALHSAFLIPALSAVWGIYSLAAVFCSRPAFATAAAILTPAFLISATSVMCDVTLIAFWVWTVRLFERGIERESPAIFISAGLLAGLAYLTKFSGLALVPLLIVYALIRRRRFGWWLITPLIALLFAAGYEILTRKLYGHGHLFQASGYAIEQGTKPHLFEKVVVGIGFAGGCFLPLLFYAPFVWPRGRWIPIGIAIFVIGLLVLPFAPGLAPVLRPNGVTHWPVSLQSALFTVSGIHLLALAVAFGVPHLGGHCANAASPGFPEKWSRTILCRFDIASLFLLLWVLGIFTFAIGVNWVINARSFLPAIPALAILVARRIDCHVPLQEYRFSWRWLAPAFAAAIITLWLTWSDYAVARSQRTTAQELCAKYHDRTTVSDGPTGFHRRTGSVWFEGHWGFQYYMQKLGAKPLDMVHPEAQKNDIVIIPNCSYGVSRPDPRIASLIDSSQFLPNHFISTLNPPAGACFYASSWGPLPFVIAPLKPDVYLVFQHTGF